MRLRIEVHYSLQGEDLFIYFYFDFFCGRVVGAGIGQYRPGPGDGGHNLVFNERTIRRLIRLSTSPEPRSPERLIGSH